MTEQEKMVEILSNLMKEYFNKIVVPYVQTGILCEVRALLQLAKMLIDIDDKEVIKQALDGSIESIEKELKRLEVDNGVLDKR